MGVKEKWVGMCWNVVVDVAVGTMTTTAMAAVDVALGCAQQCVSGVGGADRSGRARARRPSGGAAAR